MAVTSEQFAALVPGSDAFRAAAAAVREAATAAGTAGAAGWAEWAAVVSGPEVSAGGHGAFCALASRIGPEALGANFHRLVMETQTPEALEALLPFNVDLLNPESIHGPRYPYVAGFRSGCAVAALYAACRLGHLAVAERTLAWIVAGWNSDTKAPDAWIYAAGPEDPAVRTELADFESWKFAGCETGLSNIVKVAAMVAAAHGREAVFARLAAGPFDDTPQDCEKHVAVFDLGRYGITVSAVESGAACIEFIFLAVSGGSAAVVDAAWARNARGHSRRKIASRLAAFGPGNAAAGRLAALIAAAEAVDAAAPTSARLLQAALAGGPGLPKGDARAACLRLWAGTPELAAAMAASDGAPNGLDFAE